MTAKVINPESDPFQVIQKRLEDLKKNQVEAAEIVEAKGDDDNLPEDFKSRDDGDSEEETVVAPANFREEMSPSVLSKLKTITVDLPSKGVFYPEGNPMAGKTSIQVHGIGLREEDILSTKNLLVAGKATSRLINSVLITPGITAEDMLFGDRMAIVLALRVEAYGSQYMPYSADSKVTCPSCDFVFEQSFELGEIQPKELSEDMATYMSHVQYDLPVSKQTVFLRFLTSKDNLQLETIIKEKKKKIKSDIDPSASLTLIHHVMAVNNITDRKQIAEFMAGLDGEDRRAIRRTIVNEEPGMNMKQSIECPECHFELEDQDVVITNEFLYPRL